MKLYNKIMSFFWLSFGIAIVGYVTFKGMNQGFSRWKIYYVFALVAFAMFIIKRWMMNRMEKHQNYLASLDKAETDFIKKAGNSSDNKEEAKEV